MPILHIKNVEGTKGLHDLTKIIPQVHHEPGLALRQLALNSELVNECATALLTCVPPVFGGGGVWCGQTFEA